MPLFNQISSSKGSGLVLEQVLSSKSLETATKEPQPICHFKRLFENMSELPVVYSEFKLHSKDQYLFHLPCRQCVKVNSLIYKCCFYQHSVFVRTVCNADLHFEMEPVFSA